MVLLKMYEPLSVNQIFGAKMMQKELTCSYYVVFLSWYLYDSEVILILSIRHFIYDRKILPHFDLKRIEIYVFFLIVNLNFFSIRWKFVLMKNPIRE